jgi:hypothetical protein
VRRRQSRTQASSFCCLSRILKWAYFVKTHLTRIFSLDREGTQGKRKGEKVKNVSTVLTALCRFEPLDTRTAAL